MLKRIVLSSLLCTAALISSPVVFAQAAGSSPSHMTVSQGTLKKCCDTIKAMQSQTVPAATKAASMQACQDFCNKMTNLNEKDMQSLLSCCKDMADFCQTHNMKMDCCMCFDTGTQMCLCCCCEDAQGKCCCCMIMVDKATGKCTCKILK